MKSDTSCIFNVELICIQENTCFTDPDFAIINCLKDDLIKSQIIYVRVQHYYTGVDTMNFFETSVLSYSHEEFRFLQIVLDDWWSVVGEIIKNGLKIARTRFLVKDDLRPLIFRGNDKYIATNDKLTMNKRRGYGL